MRVVPGKIPFLTYSNLCQSFFMCTLRYRKDDMFTLSVYIGVSVHVINLNHFINPSSPLKTHKQ